MPGAEDMPVAGFRDDRRWGFSTERLGFTFHGNTVTHVDSPCHIFWDGTTYNGRSHSLVDAATGSGWAAVTAAADGIVTRGVLLDVARARDVPWLDPGQGVFPDDLEEAERRQGVRVRPGDAVLLRTGRGRVRHEAGADAGVIQAGWHASCLPWLHERAVALIGADTPQDVQPSGYEGVLMPVHAVGLVAMGLWLLDNCDLEACATTAAELGTWDFQLAVAPVRFAGTSGSPVNPIATF
jgi:kynurenine formamidase